MSEAAATYLTLTHATKRHWWCFFGAIQRRRGVGRMNVGDELGFECEARLGGAAESAGSR